MKVIYKYPLPNHQCILTVPYRCCVLSIQFDPPGQLCMWALHDIEPDRFMKYEFLVLGTGWETDEPLADMPTDDNRNPFLYRQTVVQEGFVWHVFMRELIE